jgi:hypothetical protein
MQHQKASLSQFLGKAPKSITTMGGVIGGFALICFDAKAQRCGRNRIAVRRASDRRLERVP